MIEDTIAAIATPIGTGGIGIIRISGTDALNVLQKIFRSREKNFVSHKIYYGFIFDAKKNNLLLDEVLVMIMLAPRTYTREDVVEINCHGGLVCVNKILDLVLKNGARLAEPGEFTKRAYLNGRIDLSQAEAVIDIINAQNDFANDIAFKQLKGKLSQEINLCMIKILDVLGQIEAAIDYPEEYEIKTQDIYLDILKVAKQIKKLLDSSDVGEIIKNGINIAIIGKPNVGKSSILNALSKKDSAIVTEIAGTTRDVIHEFINIGGVTAKILDTAGIHKTEDKIENLGIQKAFDCLKMADLILFVFDWSREFDIDDKNLIDMCKKNDKKILFVANKFDLEQKLFLEEKDLNEELIKISAQKNLGIEDLVNKIKNLFLEKNILDKNDEVYICNKRHESALRKAYESLLKTLETIKNKMPCDLISIDLRDAYDFLGEITGESVSDKIIDEIFSKYCVGK
ncbi:MAG: tRNA uridine-5-carboxymethylaminomethyl(34) synthesis GTPase MnmE [Firmicutes bacterium]|nr:tRNA uridine-5-carboxymethylaminomethyl(34) synthesis GTPase MnmE [Bacillota bacterium]